MKDQALRRLQFVVVRDERSASVARELGVEPERQGQGIGTRLMAAICNRLDRERGIGYLETNKPENVRLYRRGGFEVVAEQPVLGVTNWFMQRRSPT